MSKVPHFLSALAHPGPLRLSVKGICCSTQRVVHVEVSGVNRNFIGSHVLRELLKGILGIEPKLRLFSDSSSSRQLIARKGLGRARHMLLWIQKVRGLEIKAIKGTKNPADLGTKALTKEKIRKYMIILGNEMEGIEKENYAKNASGKPISNAMVKRTARIDTMVLMCEVGESVKFEERKDENSVCIMTMAAVFFGAIVCMFVCPAAFWHKLVGLVMPGPKSKAAMVKIDEVEEKPEGETPAKEEEEKPEDGECEKPKEEDEGKAQREMMEKRTEQLEEQKEGGKARREEQIERIEKKREEERKKNEKFGEEEREEEEKEEDRALTSDEAEEDETSSDSSESSESTSSSKKSEEKKEEAASMEGLEQKEEKKDETKGSGKVEKETKKTFEKKEKSQKAAKRFRKKSRRAVA